MKASDEERGHAMKLLTYQNKRGGDIVLTDIQAPTRRNWNSAKDAMTEALQLEKRVNQVNARRYCALIIDSVENSTVRRKKNI